MKLTFLGTRGNIEARTRRHGYHSAALVSYLRRKVMIDAGADWRGRIGAIRPGAIVITHSHPDHAWGLRDGAPCPVYATEECWSDMQDYPIDSRETMRHRTPTDIMGIEFEAFPVEHSTRAPAVGYRITAGTASIFYVPDVVYIPDRADALREIALYAGDGATVERTMVRRQGESLIGHTPLRTQLTWCEKENVAHAVFTHCGSGIVKGDERRIGPRVRALGHERGVTARIAHDGMALILRNRQILHSD